MRRARPPLACCPWRCGAVAADTRRSRGFAFVTFEREADARRAAEAMDGRNVDGRRVRCNLADERRRGGDVAGAPDRREFFANDRHETRDAKASASERHKRRRRSDCTAWMMKRLAK